MSSTAWLLAFGLLFLARASLAQTPTNDVPAPAPAPEARPAEGAAPVAEPKPADAPAPAPADAPADAPAPAPAPADAPEEKKEEADPKAARLGLPEPVFEQEYWPGSSPPPPPLGEGTHLFDYDYFLFGFNTQRLCQATSFELEGSFVPWISDGLFWGGLYATSGLQRARPAPRAAPSATETCFEGNEDDDPPGVDVIRYKLDERTGKGGGGFRMGAGGEFGWRMLATDLGFLYNSALKNQDLGFRWRIGVSLADEVFTGGMAKYAKECCLPKGCDSVVPCECPRTVVGVSIFLYYAAELYLDHDAADFEGKWWSDSSVGLSLKVAIGTGPARGAK